MKLTNQQIYNYAESLLSAFQDCDIKIPVRINFFLQKNINTMREAAIEIDNSRTQILREYGTLSEDGSKYNFTNENLQIANKEANDLFTIEQDINIHIFQLEDFDGIELTYKQMSAIMFMIEE